MTTVSASTSSVDTVAAPQVFLRDDFIWDAQRAYLFDIDGTLVRSTDRIHYTSFFTSVKDVMGRDLVLDSVTLHGNTDPGILQDAFLAAGWADSEWRPQLEEVLEGIRREVLTQRAGMQLRVMPGVVDTLRHLHATSAVLGVATGNLEVIGWQKIEVAGLREWFAFGGFADRFAVRSEMIAHAAEAARAIAGPDASVCVVGDTPADITAAQANHLPVIAVATGLYSFDELMQWTPDVCATTLEDLLRATSTSA